MRNFVAKHDFNRASTHKDHKNDYSREWDLKSHLDEYEDEDSYLEHSSECKTDACKESSS